MTDFVTQFNAGRGPAAAFTLAAGLLAAACAPGFRGATPVLRPLSDDVLVEATVMDSAIFAGTMRWVRETRADTLPPGELTEALGRRFLGAPYVAGSLDPPGPERLIINLRAFDCVTYVETVLALSRTVRAGGGPGDFRAFAHELMRLRYRDGDRPSYPARLHYFSEWIAANADRGTVEDLTERLGGEPDPRPIDFMTAHREAYPQLADGQFAGEIRAREDQLTSSPRYRIPEDRIAAADADLRTGDVIAATSTVSGLDVAHTGIAVRIDGRIYLMHAPLAGGVVEISSLPLAERILAIEGQDGVMVARPN